MSTRPSDWSPLTGGDPCPGDPSAWDAIVEFWAQRSVDIDGYREKLYQHTSIDAEGKTFGRLERTFSDGAGMASLISYEFEKASDAARSWQRKLEDMQSRADEALRKAKAAKAAKDDAQIKADGLKADAAKDKSPDPIIAVKLHGLFGGGGLEGEIADAQADIEAAQKVVDDIRGEYARESASAIGGYELASVEGIYAQPSNKSFGGNPFSSSDEVRGHVWEFDPFMLSQAFGNARQNPESFPKLLDLLSEMTPQEMKSYFSAHPEDAVFATNPMGGDNVQRAKDMQKWWNAKAPTVDKEGRITDSKDAQKSDYGMLSEDQRLALMKYAPGFVGNAQGVQYAYRSEANLNLLSVLSSDSDDSRGIPLSLDSVNIPSGVRETAKNALDHYEALRSEGLDSQIVTFEVTTSPHDSNSWDDVKAAISVGNLDEAESVSYLTHGIDTNAQESLDGHMEATQSLYNEEERLFKDNRKENEPITKHAAVAWMNYEAPEGPLDRDLTVLDNDKAYAGGHRYAQDLDTLNTLRGEQNIRLNTVAHSYGTDTTFAGMTEMKTSVDSAVFLGSAGLPQELVKAVNSGQQHLAADLKNIAYTHASEDGIAPWGYSKGWKKEHPDALVGATEINSDGGYGRSGQYFQDTDGHSLYAEKDLEGYLKDGTASRYQTGLWTTGHRDQIGPLLDYVDRSDLQVKEMGPDIYEYEPANERKSMSSAEDIERLKAYARDHDIEWDRVQDGDPR